MIPGERRLPESFNFIIQGVSNTAAAFFPLQLSTGTTDRCQNQRFALRNPPRNDNRPIGFTIIGTFSRSPNWCRDRRPGFGQGDPLEEEIDVHDDLLVRG